MATAEELLANDQCTDILWIDLDSRLINIPNTVTNIGVESDDRVLKLHFGMNRHYHGIDLSEFAFRINYDNALGEGDAYTVSDLIIEADRILFDWEVGRHACAAKGMVEFIVCLVLMNGEFVLKEFNTTTARLPVLPGKETGEAIIDQNYDVLEQWRAGLFGVGDTVEQGIIDKGEEVKAAVTKEVSESIGNVVVDYIAANSESLKGPIGEPFTYDDFTPAQLEALTGPQGETITSIERTSGNGAAGTVDTYTITTSAGKTYTFTVRNGADGGGAGDMLKSIYDPQGKNQDIFAYIDNKAVNPNLGDNPTGGVANDTVATWSNLGNGVAWISEQNQIVDQPSQYAFIINYVHDTDVFQIFHEQTDGETYFRSGDSINNWFQNWRRVIIADGDDYIDVAGVNASETVTVGNDETAMIIYTNGIGDKNSKLWIDVDGTAYFTEVYAGQKKLATEESVNTVSGMVDELFTSVSNGKALVASAITDKGVDTASDATFAVMAENIGKIETGISVKTCTLQLYVVGDSRVKSVAYMTFTAEKGIVYKKVDNSSITVLELTECVCGSIVTIEYDYSQIPTQFINCDKLLSGVKTTSGQFAYVTVGITAGPGEVAIVMGDTTSPFNLR